MMVMRCILGVATLPHLDAVFRSSKDRRKYVAYAPERDGASEKLLEGLKNAVLVDLEEVV